MSSQNWDIPYTTRSLEYVSQFKDQIKLYASQLKLEPVVGLGVAAAIAREETGLDKIYTFSPQDIAIWLTFFSSWTHEQWVDEYARYDKNNPSPLNKAHIDGTSIGKIRIATAIELLIKYQENRPEDPLNLKEYFASYNTFVLDLGDPGKETAAKIATLVGEQVFRYFQSAGTHNPESERVAQWNAYSEAQKIALIVKAYSTGIDTIARETEGKGYWHYNLAGRGSDIALYEGNMSLLYAAMGSMQPSGRLEVEIEKQSISYPGDQFLLIKGADSQKTYWFELNSHVVNDQEASISGEVPYLKHADLGEFRVERFKQVTFTAGHDVLTVDEEVDWLAGYENGWRPFDSITFNGGDGIDLIDVRAASGGWLVDLRDPLKQGVRENIENGREAIVLKNFDNANLGPDDDKFLPLTIEKPAKGADPLILDLDGDGIEVAQLGRASPYFDIDGDDWAEQVAWVTGGDGLLVRDVDGNGTIDSVAELFGNAHLSGFAALGELDSNADGVIDANDAEFTSLRVWIDADGDAISTADELKTLAELGIASIEVRKLEVGQLVRDLDGGGFYDEQATLVGNAAADEAFVETTYELEQFDTNADGVIDVSDTGFDVLRVWVDANGDGDAQADELKTLAELGLTSIGFTSTEPAEGEDQINGNAVSQIGAYKLTDGTTRQIADVELVYRDGSGSGGGGGGDGEPDRDPTAQEEDREYYSEADGGGGEDTLDYSTFEDDITAPDTPPSISPVRASSRRTAEARPARRSPTDRAYRISPCCPR